MWSKRLHLQVVPLLFNPGERHVYQRIVDQVRDAHSAQMSALHPGEDSVALKPGDPLRLALCLPWVQGLGSSALLCGCSPLEAVKAPITKLSVTKAELPSTVPQLAASVWPACSLQHKVAACLSDQGPNMHVRQ